MYLSEVHGLKDKVCHKILFKVIIVTINGKLLVLVEIITRKNLNKVGNNLSQVGSNLNKVGKNLSQDGNNLIRVGNSTKIGIPNLVSNP